MNAGGLGVVQAVFAAISCIWHVMWSNYKNRCVFPCRHHLAEAVAAMERYQAAAPNQVGCGWAVALANCQCRSRLDQCTQQMGGILTILSGNCMY